ncbi:protein phosphatase 2C domain-containing protein [Streptomyces sp. NPDC050145]|uniref:protein phosphatase 2C domain-containing protein n=1 Tax=Streptomyces sp. NPDC050145 TaxID=3365602 RepID=UPI0037A20662
MDGREADGQLAAHFDSIPKDLVTARLTEAPVQSPAPAPDVPELGAPQYSGPKPPLYPSVPNSRPTVDADLFAALLPDTVMDGASAPGVTVRAASVRGDSHRYHGEPRQDALGVARITFPAAPQQSGDGGEELLMLAVADGVGSAAQSHLGSNEVCRLAARYVRRAVSLPAVIRSGDGERFQEIADTVVERISHALSNAALDRGHEPGAYATTLRILLVPSDPSIRTRAFLAVGDGGTALLRGGFWYPDITAMSGDDTEMIDTRTAALPMSRTAQTRLIPARAGDVLVLATDGLSGPLAGDEEMREFLRAAWGDGTVPEPADFLWQFQYRVKSYDDDRTAVVLWEREEHA